MVRHSADQRNWVEKQLQGRSKGDRDDDNKCANLVSRALRAAMNRVKKNNVKEEENKVTFKEFRF